ncbi:MAG TPA: ABC transporter substrate-binding protein [Conexibacter sp.]|nr:ABC transporter substrate-binding protein [Conexibacter sp.]
MLRSHGLARILALVATVLALVAAVGCGDSSDDDAASGSTAATQEQAETAEVRLKVTPQASFAPLQLGIDQGFFEENGIDLKLETTNDPTNTPPQIVAGQVEGGSWTWGSLPVLTSAGLPIVAVAPIDTGGATAEDDFLKIVALRDSGITSIRGLEGKTVGVNTVGGLAELHVRKAAENAGIDPQSVRVLVVPFATMNAALRARRVDAVSQVEPFLTDLVDNTSVNILAGSNVEIQPNLPFATVIMSSRFVEENPDVVRRFQLGVQRSMEYAGTHEDELREVLTTFSNIPADVAAKVSLPQAATSMDLDGIQAQVDALREYDFLDRDVDISEHVIEYPLPEEN